MNGETLATLFEAHRKQMYTWARRFGAGHEDAEDMVQDALIKASRVEIIGKPSTLLYQAVKSVWLDRKRRDEVAANYVDWKQSRGTLHTMSFHALFDADEILDRLQPILRDAVFLHALGFTAQEAADYLGISAPAYKARLAYARRTLRKMED